MNLITIVNYNQIQSKQALKPFAFSFNTLKTLLQHTLHAKTVCMGRNHIKPESTKQAQRFLNQKKAVNWVAN